MILRVASTRDIEITSRLLVIASVIGQSPKFPLRSVILQYFGTSGNPNYEKIQLPICLSYLLYVTLLVEKIAKTAQNRV